MKAALFPLRLLVLGAVIAWIWSVWLCDQVREAWQRHRLGEGYEGALNNEDL
jgi:hypothetical protein